MPKTNASIHYERWVEEARARRQATNPLRLPFDIEIKEGALVSRALLKYWDPAPPRPGLSRVEARLPKSTSDDIVSLIHATQEAQTDLLLLVDPIVVDLGERARFLINELESSLEFLLDDDVEEPADKQLEAVQEFHAQAGQRSSMLHQALSGYAALAESLKDRLVEVDKEFDINLIDEAKALAAKLVEAPAAPPPSPEQVQDALLIRNGMLALLVDKKARVRKCAAHVFRDYPEIVREVTSAYERRRRAAARRAKAEAEAKKSTKEEEKKDG